MPKGLEFLQYLGLEESFLAVGVRRMAHEFRDRRGVMLRLCFNDLPTRYPYSLQLPQHETERILEQAALHTGLVEIRRQHRVYRAYVEEGLAVAEMESANGPTEFRACWGVACDGAKSAIRASLGVKQHWHDYGCDSAVADIEGDAARDPGISDITLAPARPFGWFYFAPGRWRFIYRLNQCDDRLQMTQETVVRELIRTVSPEVRVDRFLWASAFRLGQGQNATYRSQRWLFAGDAAHAMGPSAGAGMMIGMLGVWRLAARLSRAVRSPQQADALLDAYEREQGRGSRQVQRSNGIVFRNMAVTNTSVAAIRSALLRTVGGFPAIRGRLIYSEAILNQTGLCIQ
jgi:2-polyprenyl-6-methoxyphenol hydroxylase-like FAD-dependent oxidoreductase